MTNIHSITPIKICAACGVAKPITHFRTSLELHFRSPKQKGDGFDDICKLCKGKEELKRPESPEMDELLQMLEEIIHHQEAIKALKKRLKRLPERLSKSLPSEKDRIDAARYLYWSYPELPARAIASGLLGQTENELRKVVARIENSTTCERCGSPHLVVSRSDFNYKRDRLADIENQIMCYECRVIEQLFANKEAEDEWEARKRREDELKTMPYREYLQTPEWGHTRQAKLKQAGFRCQICNVYGQPLQVHHRTYERRGHERSTDLIVLCAPCHETLHEHGIAVGKERWCAIKR